MQHIIYATEVEGRIVATVLWRVICIQPLDMINYIGEIIRNKHFPKARQTILKLDQIPFVCTSERRLDK